VLPILAIIASTWARLSSAKLFGRRKLAPQVSPNKTLEGAFGGLGLAVLIVSMTTYGSS
jgi:phosphatidate cytidylyltransferase